MDLLFSTNNRQYQLRCIKIDRQFCAESTVANGAVVTAAVGLGDSLGIEVIAEGIETLAMREELIDLGCTVGQGYLLGKPRGVSTTRE